MQCNGARKHLRACVFYLACLFAVCMVIEVINHTNSRVILLSGDDDYEPNQPRVCIIQASRRGGQCHLFPRQLFSFSFNECIDGTAERKDPSLKTFTTNNAMDHKVSISGDMKIPSS